MSKLIILAISFGSLILISCNAEKKDAPTSDKTEKVAKQEVKASSEKKSAKKSDQKAKNANRKFSDAYYQDIQSTLKLTDDQIALLKKLNQQRKRDLKEATTSEQKVAVNKSIKAAKREALGIKLYRKLVAFDKNWSKK